MVVVGAEPAQHVYRMTWGGDLQASPVLEPIQLGPGVSAFQYHVVVT